MLKCATRTAESSPRSPKAGPRICKPTPEDRLRQQQNHQELFSEDANNIIPPSVRGRRKPLYSVPNRSEHHQTSTHPQIPPKPTIAPKPRNISSSSIAPSSIGANKRIPGSPRGTRSTQLRQATKTKLNSPPSPKITPPKYKQQTAESSHHQLTTPKGSIPRGRAPLASPAPSTISSASSTTSSANSSKLVRQGTFTKEESSSCLTGNPVIVDIDVGDKKPPKKPNSGSTKARSPRSLTVGGNVDANGGGPPVIPQTRTSALRERSRSRQGSGSSTTSSNRSIPRPNNSQNSLKQSNSNQSLNSSRLGRRTPTNVDIVRTGNKVPPVKDIPDTVSESAVTSKKSTGKKIESRIASLWKKVEDTKKKDKVISGHGHHGGANEKNSKDSKKVWISKGRVIPENEMAFLRPDEQQKKLIKDFQKAKADSSLNDSSSQQQQPNNSVSSSSSIGANAGSKIRSRSRLSMKLPKFNSSSKNNTKDTNNSSGFKKENSFTFTSHATTKQQQHPTPAPRTNYSSSSHHPYGTTTSGHLTSSQTGSASVPSTPTVEDVLNGNNHHDITAMQQQDDSKRISRTGSFVNPMDDQIHRKAIVQPFNYINPNIVQQVDQNQDQVDDPKKLRRNDSYVSSMGRTREELLAASAARKRQVQATATTHLEVQDEILDVDDKGAQQHTDSVLVTLV